MEHKKFVQEYYIIEKDGKVWGQTPGACSDGECSDKSYRPFGLKPFEDNGRINLPMEDVDRFSESHTKYLKDNGLEKHWTWGSDKVKEELKQGTLRKIRVTTTIEFID